MVFPRPTAVLAAFLIPAAVGCAPSGAETKAPPRGPLIGAPSTPWREKTHDEKRAFMAAYVVPVMGRKFKAFDQKSYADFGCETCHGSDMDIVDFKMPNSLYALPEKDTIAEARSYDAETTKFMVEQVVPTFSMLLSEHAANPGDPTGVTCFTCHQRE